MEKYWRSFVGETWQREIDLRDFIQQNYTYYTGSADFLKGTTSRTDLVKKEVERLLVLENEKGGVLDIDTNKASSILTFKPGYILKDHEIIVGLQTDRPLKRAVNPFAGYRNAVQACKAYGYEIGESVHNEFKYRTTHNTGVFRVYTDTMKKARHAGVLTGLPDAYGRGRIIGDYRRIALYGMDFLIAKRKEDKKRISEREMNDETIHLLEDVERQIEFMNQLVEMASDYGFDITKPA
ncbi:MAG: formate acetyltransferase, partial [Clostridia bacterium]|nr:formate acetyltransferase [Clostridia bacterium]